MSLFPIKLQFFLTYGILGSLGPLLALLLKQSKGFTPREIAVTLAVSSIGMLFSPAVMTFLADRDFDSRRILRFIFASTAVALVGVYVLESHLNVTLAYAVYSLLFVPTIPLLDGYFFNHERSTGKSADSGGYQFVRVWGTIGFLVPAVALYFIIDDSSQVIRALWCAIAWCAMSFASTYALDPCKAGAGGRTKAPTADALRTLFAPATLPMCIGLFFAYAAANAYYPYLSIFLKDVVGIHPKWLALIMALGVLIEIGYLYGLGPLRRWLHIRGIIIFGLATMSLRLAALALFPSVSMSLLIQVLHGLEILAIFVVPVIYLNRVAGDGFRNSIQGAFAIAVSVPARLVGFLAAGEIAERFGPEAVLIFASELALLGMVIILLFFKPLPAPAADAGDQGST